MDKQFLRTDVDEQEEDEEEVVDSDSVSADSSIASDNSCEGLEDFNVNLNLSTIDEPTQLIHGGQNYASGSHSLSKLGLKFIREHVELPPLFYSMALQQYILLCSKMEEGFRDKPGKNRDLYHTCYCLSGLSVSQYICSEKADSRPMPRMVWGPFSNLLQPVHPLYNLVLDRFYDACRFFSRAAN